MTGGLVRWHPSLAFAVGDDLVLDALEILEK
jgi:hypothetical protein